jgi:hypothetical protein
VSSKTCSARQRRMLVAPSHPTLTSLITTRALRQGRSDPYMGAVRLNPVPEERGAT